MWEELAKAAMKQVAVFQAQASSAPQHNTTPAAINTSLPYHSNYMQTPIIRLNAITTYEQSLVFFNDMEELIPEHTPNRDKVLIDAAIHHTDPLDTKLRTFLSETHGNCWAKFKKLVVVFVAKSRAGQDLNLSQYLELTACEKKSFLDLCSAGG